MFVGETWVVDGGLGTTLEETGHHVDGDPLWSARLLSSNPQAIKDVHLAFLAANANVVTTASYQASIPGFKEHLKVSEEVAVSLINKSVSLAREAILEHSTKISNEGKKPIVAGSIGPYGACQADRSEYTGDYVSGMTSDDLMTWHRPRMSALVKCDVDILAIETIPSLTEALSILQLLREFPHLKAWLTFSCKDGEHTRYGDKFGEAVKACYEYAGDQLVAIGVNCTHPKYIGTLLANANCSLPPPSVLPRVVYPDSGEMWITDQGWSGRTKKCPFSNEIKSWKKLGASIIGGCCRTNPSDIQEIADIVSGVSPL